jgi:hypothetical protein
MERNLLKKLLAVSVARVAAHLWKTYPELTLQEVIDLADNHAGLLNGEYDV